MTVTSQGCRNFFRGYQMVKNNRKKMKIHHLKSSQICNTETLTLCIIYFFNLFKKYLLKYCRTTFAMPVCARGLSTHAPPHGCSGNILSRRTSTVSSHVYRGAPSDDAAIEGGVAGQGASHLPAKLVKFPPLFQNHSID